MNGVHDVGGMHGFGPIEREANEPAFHAEWEKAAFVMPAIGLVKRLYNLDEFRHAIERMGHARYLATSYYEHWLAGVETLLVEKGVLTRAELDQRIADAERDPAAPLPERTDPELLAQVMHMTRTGIAHPSRPAPAPRFAPGDAVITRNWQPAGHTRLPAYARGHRGRIHLVHGVYALPDANAHGRGPSHEPLYNVAFEAGELWGDAAEPKARVHIDLFESYLHG